MSNLKSENKNDKNLEIKEQIEYYLSDKNLQNDSFFHQKISENPNGYLELNFLLKCNKCKKAGWTLDELKEALKLSDMLELDETETKVRRKGNKPLPELILLAKKRKKDDEEDEKEPKEPIILMFTCKEPNESNWKNVCEAFKTENPELNVIYSRFKSNLGHIAVIPNNDDDEEDLKFKDKFKYDEIEYTVKKCEDEDLIQFYKEHGGHYKKCKEMNERKNKKGKKKEKSKGKKNKKQKVDNNKNNTQLKKEITLGELKFNDASVIKAETRKIINDTKDDEKLDEKNSKFILDLLKYHHKYEEKIKDLNYITVGKPENYDSSRCFIAVDKNNNRKDFSAQKCIDNLIKTINEE